MSETRSMSKQYYYVHTWDSVKEEWTPQRGVRCGPYTLFGLRKALRKLRAIGYTARKFDPAVSVMRADLGKKP